MVKKEVLALCLVLLFIGFLKIGSSAIVINEFESNPQGSDTNLEWIELYNNDSIPINISMWQIFDKDSNSLFTATNETFIAANGFYVADFLNGFVNAAGDNATLKNNLGNVVDSTPNLIDNDDNNKTWSRIPDGTGAFVFQESTKGNSNGNITSPVNITIVDINVTDLPLTPLCVIESDVVTLGANVTSGCVESVVFSVFKNGTWQNFTGSNTGGNRYTKIFQVGNFEKFKQYDWKVFARDCNGNFANGTINSFYVNSKTNLGVSPASPNGRNLWYITEPNFELLSPNSTEIFYQWNGYSVRKYFGDFGLGNAVENASNNANVSGGNFQLNFFGNVCSSLNGINESQQTKSIKTDFLNPQIESLTPEPNSSVFAGEITEVSIHIDEIYSGNSGVNVTSIVMRIDGISVQPDITKVGIDANVRIERSFIEGEHNVSIYVEDNAGRSSQTSWTFLASQLQILTMNVVAPTDGIYENKRVAFNLSTNREATIEYINYNDRTPRFKLLCSNCDNYGNDRIKLQTLNEGKNNITIRARDVFGQEVERNIFLFVDSKSPKISKIEPKKGFASGDFAVEFIEENLQAVNLFYGNESWNVTQNIELENCLMIETKIRCDTQANLSEFDGQTINYWFAVEDILNNSVESKKVQLDIDTTLPVVNEFNFELNGNRVAFAIDVEDINFERIAYVDKSVGSERLRTICTRLNFEGNCVKTISFSNGQHLLDIFAYDKAGNRAVVTRDLLIFVQ